MPPRIFFLTQLALLAFAGNSLLCRIALKQTAIDPTTFVALRIVSGALMLWLVLHLRKRNARPLEGNWYGALALLAYAVAFSFAYTRIPAGTGALLLFASIQISMILYGLLIGERLSFVQGVGVGLAVCGLAALLLPAFSAPPLFQACLMIVSGVAWGVYSLLGRGAKDPASATAGNFIRAAPIAIVLFLLNFQLSHVEFDAAGIGYAVASGAVTSGLGYIFWYAALKELKVTHAATVQLSVPVLAAFGGTLFLGEPVTRILVIASVLILLGVFLVVQAKRAA
ncbi:DMT family transporter [Achromobacter deleyi]|uniref:DMT family transporter n=1 Tax=Achromobacter deleyi TaxID=1353891 RepID=UPI001490A8B1|nr:DMT family transporter [Achromobacter deleyi]QVQ25992.1 DMT family transporter [Achromobacter deleyi]UIP21539.1 DMT family transporter [Achromobacter deleyi]